MYKLLLILKYLRRKITPMFAALAVTLCTAMVIIVISVMGGFLDLMRHSAKKLTGEATIDADVLGFTNYEQMLSEIRLLPEVEAATAVIRSFGLVNLHGRIFTVEVLGIDSYGLDAVTGYGQTLYWTNQRLERESLATAHLSDEQRKWVDQERHFYERFDLEHSAMRFDPPPGWIPEGAPPLHGIVLGIEISPYNARDDQGRYLIQENASLQSEVSLTLLRLDDTGVPSDPAYERFLIVNEFKSGLYEIDAHRVYIPFDKMQQLMRMDATPAVDEDFTPTGELLPARASEIMVKSKPDVSLEELARSLELFKADFLDRYPGMDPPRVRTWEQRHSTLLNAVQNEKGLITFLFAVISIVAFVMVTTTFYSIVLEKTRDIGVLRALGASRLGIVHIFISYGLAIGIVGSTIGLALAVVIVTNLNEIQEGIYQFTLWWSDGEWAWRMWDPRIYYFDRIPDRVDFTEVVWIMLGSVASCVVGAFIPAILASRVNPVESLRYE